MVRGRTISSCAANFVVSNASGDSGTSGANCGGGTGGDSDSCAAFARAGGRLIRVALGCLQRQLAPIIAGAARAATATSVFAIVIVVVVTVVVVVVVSVVVVVAVVAGTVIAPASALVRVVLARHVCFSALFQDLVGWLSFFRNRCTHDTIGTSHGRITQMVNAPLGIGCLASARCIFFLHVVSSAKGMVVGSRKCTAFACVCVCGGGGVVWWNAAQVAEDGESKMMAGVCSSAVVMSC
ncbi:hypothetical protein PTSG_13052 [Salpingoeca rosetta]|uniref:Uncharacterized protein n=1 Tax=Salpingoeca rosetta (strain ATCC 50818 / BSB-021) TaxID=946362 RepID=F2UPQ6_SALR5|nr:uncharacterized protein PTSG_13052 [Salpingoeca rosetta]EGD79611.1 hypothetical protein PTSG_13052 [Salpingoeca rosetta]|eukprot:XP_004988839.1 hypothetical protein PTSG_13052 [Salpingoeca rosetta]